MLCLHLLSSPWGTDGTEKYLVATDRSYFPITKFSIEQSNGITSISDYLRVP